MKKFFIILITAVLLFSATGCNTAKPENKNSNDITSQNTKTENNTSEISNNTNDNKVLVVYYSATGTTERIAKIISDSTNADVFIITPEQEYSSEDLNWNNKNSRVSIEHDNPDKRDVKLKSTHPDNFENYDTVFIGYPIWWGIAAWPVDNFVKENDFTGKNVIPFCTAASSNIGESGNLLAEKAGTGEWQQGKRFYSNSSESEITDWIESLNI